VSPNGAQYGALPALQHCFNNAARGRQARPAGRRAPSARASCTAPVRCIPLFGDRPHSLPELSFVEGVVDRRSWSSKAFARFRNSGASSGS
jgi:hypothetical protein